MESAAKTPVFLAGKKGDAELNTALSSGAKFIAGETQGMWGKLNKTTVWSVKPRVTKAPLPVLKRFP